MSRSHSRGRPLSAEVAESLQNDIRSGRLQPGAKLPTEKDLALEFGVSRSAVREAIAELRTAQLLHTRHGSGTFVVQEPSRPALFTLSSRGFDRLELCHIFELRTEVEAGAAALAARYRASEHLERMRHALDALANAVNHGGLGVEDDMAFHTSIAAASGNRFFEEFMEFFAGRVAESISIARTNTARVAGRARLVHHEHQSIYEAIAAGEAEQARVAMQFHLQNAARRLGLSREAPAKEQTK